MSKFQPSSFWSEVELKNLEVVVLLHNSIQFVQFTTDTKTAQSVILSLPCLTAGSFTFTPPHIPLVIVEKYSIPISPGHQTCIQKAFGLSTWAVANFIQAWRCQFWSRSFFLGRQHLSPWRFKTLHGGEWCWYFSNFQFMTGLSLRGSWTSKSISPHPRESVWVVFQILAKWWHIWITGTYVQLVEVMILESAVV